VGTGSTATRLRFLDGYLSPKDRGTLTELEWAARRGEAAWYTCWKTSHSQITLLLDGGGGMADLRVEYRPTADETPSATSNPSP